MLACFLPPETKGKALLYDRNLRRKHNSEKFVVKYQYLAKIKSAVIVMLL